MKSTRTTILHKEIGVGPPGALFEKILLFIPEKKN